jgi:hypothetical protein
MLIPVLTLILVFSLLRLFLWRCLNAERRSECNTKNSAHLRYSHSLHVSPDSATPSEMASAQAVTHKRREAHGRTVVFRYDTRTGRTRDHSVAIS